MRPVWFHKLVPNAKTPEYQTPGAAGADLFAVEDVQLYPGYWKAIGTGIAIDVPTDFEVQIRSRSGLAAKHGIAVLNSPGTIDSDYRGEVKVILINHGATTYDIKAGDRIAQMVLAPVERAIFGEVLKLSETLRGAGGLGSTGV